MIGIEIGITIMPRRVLQPSVCEIRTRHDERSRKRADWQRARGLELALALARGGIRATRATLLGWEGWTLEVERGRWRLAE